MEDDVVYPKGLNTTSDKCCWLLHNMFNHEEGFEAKVIVAEARRLRRREMKRYTQLPLV